MTRAASALMAIGTALPEFALDAGARQELLAAVWPRLARIGVQNGATSSSPESGGMRYLAEPADRLLVQRGLTETMTAYRDQALLLAERAVRSALEGSKTEPKEIDAVITVSCTGYLVPSLDVHLIEALGMRSDVIRLPITELGCSGGAAALAFAHRHLSAYPEQRVLVVAVELPSLTFQPGDASLDNLTASMVFGDGAGAAVMAGAGEHDRGLVIERVASHLIPGSSAALGYDLRDDGFHVVLDRRLPALIRRSIGEVATRFSDPARRPIDFLAAHGGGPRVLDAIQAGLNLEDRVMAGSRRTYAEIGNVSSASILFTLGAQLRCLGPAPLKGLGIGLGPGVSLELMELAWRP